MVESRRITINPQDKLSEIIRSDGHTVKNVKKCIGENYIGGNFAHDIHGGSTPSLRSLFSCKRPRNKTALGHNLECLHSFPRSPAKRNHRDNIGKPDLFSHSFYRAAFKFERIPELRIIVTRG